MFRISLLIVAIVLLCCGTGYAQPFNQVTHTTGTQIINGNSVTVTSGGSVTIGTNCGIGPYAIGLGNLNGSYTFAFSLPVNRLRLRFAVFHTTESYDVIINGVKHMVVTGDVSAHSGTCAGPFPLPSVISGTVINNSATYIDCAHQTDILSPVPIDSVRIQRYASTQGGYSGFDFAFRTDSIVVIDQPFVDTVKCAGDSMYVAYSVLPAFAPGNVFTAQLSDAAGSFASPVNIGTLASSAAGVIPCVLPAGTLPGNGYRVRIVATSPVRISTDNAVNIRVKTNLSTPPVAASNSPICEGSTLNLSASFAGTGVVYNWIGPLSYTSAAQNPSIFSATPAHSGDYVVTASINGCFAKDTVTVLVKPMPAVPTANNNGPVCEGSTLNLSATSTTAGVSYSWVGPSSFSSPFQNPAITGATTGNSGTYSVTATLNGCTSAAATTAATVKPMPAVPTATNNTPVCAGADVQLTATSATPGVTYNWAGPNGFNSTLQAPVIAAANPWDTGTYKVTATLNGCTSAEGDTKVIINLVSSIGGWASPNDTICAGELATFVMVPTNPGPTPQYQWFKNGAPLAGETSTLLKTTAVATGDSFYCQMIAPNVCANTLTLYSNGFKMYVLPLVTTPAARISTTPAIPQPGQPVLFYANVTSSGYSPTFQWQRNGVNVPGAIHANWSANNLHPYDRINCIVQSSDFCANPKTAYSDTVVVNFPTGVNEVQDNGRISLYPNPNNGTFSIDLPLGPFEGEIEVVNAIGQVVYVEEFKSQNSQSPITNGKSPITITLPASVSNGVYLLRAESGGEVNVLRFTVNR